MYVWNVELYRHWDNDPKGFFDEHGTMEYTVAANDYDKALEKARKLALKATYTDDDTGKDHRVTDVRLKSIKRGVELDA